MLGTFLLALALVLLLIAGMSIGVIFGRKPISGSCGGIANELGGGCSVCGRESGSCDDDAADEPGTDSSLAYNAEAQAPNRSGQQ